jgi:HEAT repeat protein
LVVGLLKKALKDPNKKVRRLAAGAILSLDPPDEQTRAEIVALTVPLLADPSVRVRRTAWAFRPWATHVPIEPVLRAFLEEKDRHARAGMEHLLRAILRAREGRLDGTNY